MASPPFRYDFSLWYCLEDDPIASKISSVLGEHGFRGYMEHQDQVAGQPVVGLVCEVIQASRVAIVLVTPHSVADAWCQRVAEWNLIRAIEWGAKVIPVYVGVSPEQAPLALRHLSGLCYDNRYFKHRLLASLQTSVSGRRTPRPLGRPAGAAAKRHEK